LDHDLLFHVTTEDDWKANIENGSYSPASLEEDGFILCAVGEQVEKVANNLYQEAENPVLLVIDPLRIQAPVKYTDTEYAKKLPAIYDSISMDAVIDRIKLYRDDKGKFHINIRQYD